jgi:hypothetical protein
MASDLPAYQGRTPGAGGGSKTVTTTKTVQPKAGGSRQFNAAFRAARKAGKDEFSFGGKRYTTELAKPKTVTETKTVAQSGPKKVVILNRQGRLETAMGRNARGQRVPATTGPTSLGTARTYFDRPAPTAEARERARRALDRSPEARAPRRAALERNANIALNVASAVPLLGMAARGAKAALAARAIGKAAKGVGAARAGTAAAAAGEAASATAPAVAKVTRAVRTATARGTTKKASTTVAKTAGAPAPKPVTGAKLERKVRSYNRAVKAADAPAASAPARAAAPRTTVSTKAKLLTSGSTPRPTVSSSTSPRAPLRPSEPAINRVGSSPTAGEQKRALTRNVGARAAKKNPELAAASRQELAKVHSPVGRPRQLSATAVAAENKRRGLAVPASVAARSASELGFKAAAAPTGKAVLRSTTTLGSTTPAAAASKVDTMRQAALAAGKAAKREARAASKGK